MKNCLYLLLIILSLVSCSSNRYVLSDTDGNKDFLKQKIDEFKKTEGISNKPIIVVDGKPYRYTHELKENKLKLSKSDIKKIDVLKKDVGIRIYGEFAEAGVLLITTKSELITNKEESYINSESKSLDESKIFILVDGKEFPKEDLEKISPNDIESVTVIKNKEEIKKYTSKEYDGVIIIVMKKQ